jgi:hypothetical protein
MIQYPHTLQVKQVSESTQNPDGSWSNGGESWVYVTECREETNGKGTLIALSDGQAIVFSSVVYMPVNVLPINVLTEIQVLSNDGIRITGKVLKFDKGQLNCRLWL